MIRTDSESQRLLATLKRHLKSGGWTASRIAQTLSIGEATAKRWLVGKALTLDRLEALAALVDLSLADLTRSAERPQAGLAQELTLAQEKALSSDIVLAFIFMTILGGTPPQELAEDFGMPDRDLEAALTRLERLALIDRLTGNRVRPRIDRAIIWRKTPMRALFEAHMKQQFMDMDFAADDAVYASHVMKLSAQGAAQLAELIDRHRREAQALAERDRDEAHLPGQWWGMLCAARVLDTGALRE